MNHLSHLSTVSFSGSDAKEFLQGQMTQDINTISDQSYKMTSILNPKGRIIVTGLIKEFKGKILSLKCRSSVLKNKNKYSSKKVENLLQKCSKQKK